MRGCFELVNDRGNTVEYQVSAGARAPSPTLYMPLLEPVDLCTVTRADTYLLGCTPSQFDSLSPHRSISDPGRRRPNVNTKRQPVLHFP